MRDRFGVDASSMSIFTGTFLFDNRTSASGSTMWDEPRRRTRLLRSLSSLSPISPVVGVSVLTFRRCLISFGGDISVSMAVPRPNNRFSVDVEFFGLTAAKSLNFNGRIRRRPEDDVDITCVAVESGVSNGLFSLLSDATLRLDPRPI